MFPPDCGLESLEALYTIDSDLDSGRGGKGVRAWWLKVWLLGVPEAKGWQVKGHMTYDVSFGAKRLRKGRVL